MLASHHVFSSHAEPSDASSHVSQSTVITVPNIAPVSESGTYILYALTKVNDILSDIAIVNYDS